ncbi:unnamed protein product [Orchesella dallaii]|uniref:YEATS domain-containing protein n=1 Tax=Orchesella dallaii TaxID=48710 RepID=A0ABP1PY59_9HEXA
MASSSPLSAASGQVVQDYGPDSGGRLKGLSVVKPIVIGNIAKYFGKKREEDGHTHQWTIYMKPYPNEDYSCFIKKVHFKLHDSYANPNRIVTKPPYEVSETGWGEFEVAVKIHFIDPVERPVTVYHVLKLFQSGSDHQSLQNVPKKTVTAETYDEMVFQEPTRYMKSLLDSVVPLTLDEYKHETDFEEKKKSSMAKIAAAKEQVRAEIQELKEKLKLSRETIEQVKMTPVESHGGEKTKSRKEESPRTPKN